MKEQIIEVIRQVISNKGEVPPTLVGSTAIDGSLGLASLDWAEVVVRLEDRLGYDPFQEGVSIELNTVDDLVTLYEGMQPETG